MKKYLNNKSFFWNPATDDTAASAFCRPKAATMTKDMSDSDSNGNFGIVGGGAGLAIGC